MKNFGERVKYYREKAGMTQEELAKRMGYSHKSSITKIEKGIHDLPLSKVRQLALILGVSEGTLMGWY